MLYSQFSITCCSVLWKSRRERRKKYLC